MVGYPICTREVPMAQTTLQIYYTCPFHLIDVINVRPNFCKYQYLFCLFENKALATYIYNIHAAIKFFMCPISLYICDWILEKPPVTH